MALLMRAQAFFWDLWLLRRASDEWLVQVPHTGTESLVPADFGTGGTAYRLFVLVDQCILAKCRGVAAAGRRPMRRRRIAA